MTTRVPPEIDRTGNELREIVAPPHSLMLSLVDGKESDRHRCGEQRVRAAFPGKKVPRELAALMTQRCYVLPAGARTKLRVAFLDGKEKASPKGSLVLEVDRGKISPSRIELDGSKNDVVVEYTAPDETIRVSVRAFLAGFARGKVHLHLEG